MPPPAPPRRDEAAEKAGPHVLGHRPLIDDQDRDSAAFASHDDAGGALGVAVDDGVVDQIVDGPRQPIGLTADDGVGDRP